MLLKQNAGFGSRYLFLALGSLTGSEMPAGNSCVYPTSDILNWPTVALLWHNPAPAQSADGACAEGKSDAAMAGAFRDLP